MLRNLIISWYTEAHLVCFVLYEIKFGVHDTGGGGDEESVFLAVGSTLSVCLPHLGAGVVEREDP